MSQKEKQRELQAKKEIEDDKENKEWKDAGETRKLITAKHFLFGMLKNDGAKEDIKDQPNFEKMAIEMKSFIGVAIKDRDDNEKECTTAAASYYNILKSNLKQ